MNTGLLILILVIVAFLLIIFGVPVYASLGLAGTISLIALTITKGAALSWIVIPSSIYNGATMISLLAIPFYVFAGELMNKGGITKKLVAFAQLLIGRLPASLAQANIVSSMFFGGITGSCQADTSCIGGLLIPAMVDEGYTPEEAVGVTITSSTCGPIIPPSIMMVVFGVAVGCSIGGLFMAGVIPGLLIGFSLMGMVLLRDRKYHFPRRTGGYTKEERRRIIKEGLLPLGMPIIVFGGIMGGVFTATEAGAAAVFYSLIVGLFITRNVKVKDLYPMLLKSATMSATVLLIIACAKIFSYALATLQMSTIVANAILSLTQNKYVFLLLVNIVLLIMGMFMDGSAAVILLAPILMPVASTMGISTLHFGVIMVLNLIIGAGTPPLGACLFIGCKIADIPVERGVKGAIPYILTELVVLILVTYIPALCTWFPALMGYAI